MILKAKMPVCLLSSLFLVASILAAGSHQAGAAPAPPTPVPTPVQKGLSVHPNELPAQVPVIAAAGTH